MHLDLSILDGGPGSKQGIQTALPVLDGADLDKGAFAMPAVHDVSDALLDYYRASLTMNTAAPLIPVCADTCWCTACRSTALSGR